MWRYLQWSLAGVKTTLLNFVAWSSRRQESPVVGLGEALWPQECSLGVTHTWPHVWLVVLGSPRKPVKLKTVLRH